MAKEFFSGRNLQQAILAAARRFALDPEEVAYAERDRSGGFIKNPKVVIEVDPSSPRRLASAVSAPLAPARGPSAPSAMSPAPAPSAPPVTPPGPGSSVSSSSPPRRSPAVATGDPVLAQPAAKEAAALLARLAGLDVEPAVSIGGEPGELVIDLRGPGAPAIAAQGGELLEALEQLAPRLLRGLGADPVFCRVDAAGFRADREAALRAMALEAAALVRREGRPQALPELPPAERRIVHLTLEADPAVRTVSLGDGFRKSITVRPA